MPKAPTFSELDPGLQRALTVVQLHDAYKLNIAGQEQLTGKTGVKNFLDTLARYCNAYKEKPDAMISRFGDHRTKLMSIYTEVSKLASNNSNEFTEKLEAVGLDKSEITTIQQTYENPSLGGGEQNFVVNEEPSSIGGAQP